MNNRRLPSIPEERPLTDIRLGELTVQSPVPAFVAKRKTKTTFHRGPNFGIEAFVDDNLAALKPDRAANIRFGSDSSAGNAQQAGQVIELDAQFQMFLNDVFH